MRRREYGRASLLVPAASPQRRVALAGVLLAVLTGCSAPANTPDATTQQSPAVQASPATPRTDRATPERCLVPVQDAAPTPATSGLRPTDCLIRGPLTRTSRSVRCAPGTRSLGIHPGFVDGRSVGIRLCAVAGLLSDSPESTPGDPYYLPGARGRAVVNARVSAAVAALTREAATRGVPLFANSAFRSRERQRDLCRADAGCRGGDHTYIAPPGYSNHQLGVAVDFEGTYATGGLSCGRGRASDPGSQVWRFLDRHASAVGLRQYSAESWHWDAFGGSARC